MADKNWWRWIAVGCVALACACGDDDEPSSDGGMTDVDASQGDGDGDGDADGPGPAEAFRCDVVAKDEDCDASLRPIVFIHGTFGSATEISKTAMRFGSNGYCQDRFVAVEYNSLGGSPAAQLAALVDEVLERTGFDQVDLMGHSQGTGHACTFLEDEASRAKVAHYVNLSGLCHGWGVPTLSLSSDNDLRGGNIHPPSATLMDGTQPDITTYDLTDEDHVAIAGSRLAFIEMYKFLGDGEDPEYDEVQCGDEMITLSGKAVSFGDNEPQVGGKIEVHAVDAYADSPFDRGEPYAVVEADADGNIAFQVARGVQYELRAFDEDGEMLGNVYFAPFKRSNYLLRVLGVSQTPAIAAQSTDRIVTGDGHMAIVARYIGGAFRPDWGNRLRIDGQEVLSADNAPKNASVIGLFMYDSNENGQTDLGVTEIMSSFIRSTDVFVDSSEPRWVEIEWTNEDGERTDMKVPSWPSSTAQTSLNLP